MRFAGHSLNMLLNAVVVIFKGVELSGSEDSGVNHIQGCEGVQWARSWTLDRSC